MPIQTRSLYEACSDLFDTYPLAVDDQGDIRLMVLVLDDSDQWPQFVELVHQPGPGSYLVVPWEPDPAPPTVITEAGSQFSVPPALAAAVTRGVPLPAHGSLFGWVEGGIVTGLAAMYTQYTPQRPLPLWCVMPPAGAAEDTWPPFTGTTPFGAWVWEYIRAGRLVPLSPMIAATPDCVFRVSTGDAFAGAGCIAVIRDIPGAGFTLPEGRYTFWRTLRNGLTVPAMDDLTGGRYPLTDLSDEF